MLVASRLAGRNSPHLTPRLHSRLHFFPFASRVHKNRLFAFRADQLLCLLLLHGLFVCVLSLQLFFRGIFLCFSFAICFPPNNLELVTLLRCLFAYFSLSWFCFCFASHSPRLLALRFRNSYSLNTIHCTVHVLHSHGEPRAGNQAKQKTIKWVQRTIEWPTDSSLVEEIT